MILRRVAALVLAIAMVVLAVVVRNEVIDDGDAGRSRRDPLRLVCASEVSDACRSLADSESVEVIIEPAGTTAARLIEAADASTVQLDGWLAPEPWAGIVASERARAAKPVLLATPSPPVARTPLVIAVWRARRQVLEAACGTPLDWSCLARVGGAPWASIGGDASWGRVRPGQPDPIETAAGLTVLGQVGTELLGRTDFSRADLETEEFLVPFSRLERSVPTYAPPAGSPFGQMLLERTPATFDAAGAYESEAGPALEGAAVRNDLVLLYPAPVVTANLVFAGVAGETSALASIVTGDAGRQALAAAGWRVEGEPRAAGVPARPTLPASSGLPGPGPMQALQSTWEQVTG